jgi:choline kinase
MRAILLSAGVGSRLMPLTRNTPKSLIDIGDGYTLLERQLKALTDGGVEDVTIVTGYKSRQIEAKVADLTTPEIEIEFNPFYKSANNSVSAWFGMRGRTEDVMLINGDDIFSSRIVERLRTSKAEIGMAVSVKSHYDEDDMKVTIRDGRVVDVRKTIGTDHTDAESIGMTVYQGRGLRSMQDQLRRMMEDESSHHLFYLEALRSAAVDGQAIEPIECAADEWAEIDFHPDVEFAKSVVARMTVINEPT